jgi:hypothetical protein
VSGFVVETALNPDGPFGERTIQNRILSSRHSTLGYAFLSTSGHSSEIAGPAGRMTSANRSWR